MNENKYYNGYYKAPFGFIGIIGNDYGIEAMDFLENKPEIISSNPSSIVINCCNELDEYFKGQRKNFSVKLSLKGTDFQVKVWKELMKIPYGKTVTYKDIAIAVENEKAVRAVGGANNKNKIPIIIPCHRVIGTNGKLVGYAGGTDIKKFLLNLEGINID